MFPFKHPASSAEAGPPAASIVTYIPALVFRLKRPPGGEVLVNSLRLVSGGSTVLASLSNGQKMQWDVSSGALRIDDIDAGRGRVHKSLISRNLAAWIIDGVWRSVRNKRTSATASQVRTSFDGFQREAVLVAVTPAALYDLVVEISRRRTIQSVRWDSGSTRFEVG